MANQISMSQKQSIAALHAQGVSNRQIAALLNLHRDTVNRHVRQLKTENRPEAPLGDFSGITPVDTVQPGCAERFELAGGGEVAERSILRPGTSPPGATAGEPNSDVIWEETEVVMPGAQPPLKTGHGSPAEISQNRPEAPPGKISQLELFDPVPRQSFASWEDPLRLAREQFESIQNRSGAPPWLSGSQPGKKPGINSSLCTEHHQVIVAGLERGLQAQRIWQDLVSEHGFQGKYWSVKRSVMRLKSRQPLPFRRLETAAGLEAQVDFGQGAWVKGPDGKRRRPWVFRVVLSHSRKGYSEVVWRQTTEAFVDCLENAFRHFGGVPERIVLDNLKAAVTKADWYDPEIHLQLQSFAQHHGTVFLPTKPYTPRHKGKIEGGVKYVHNNALAGRTFAMPAGAERIPVALGVAGGRPANSWNHQAAGPGVVRGAGTSGPEAAAVQPLSPISRGTTESAPGWVCGGGQGVLRGSTGVCRAGCLGAVGFAAAENPRRQVAVVVHARDHYGGKVPLVPGGHPAGEGVGGGARGGGPVEAGGANWDANAGLVPRDGPGPGSGRNSGAGGPASVGAHARHVGD